MCHSIFNEMCYFNTLTWHQHGSSYLKKEIFFIQKWKANRIYRDNKRFLWISHNWIRPTPLNLTLLLEFNVPLTSQNMSSYNRTMLKNMITFVFQNFYFILFVSYPIHIMFKKVSNNIVKKNYGVWYLYFILRI